MAIACRNANFACNPTLLLRGVRMRKSSLSIAHPPPTTRQNGKRGLEFVATDSEHSGSNDLVKFYLQKLLKKMDLASMSFIPLGSETIGVGCSDPLRPPAVDRQSLTDWQMQMELLYQQNKRRFVRQLVDVPGKEDRKDCP